MRQWRRMYTFGSMRVSRMLRWTLVGSRSPHFSKKRSGGSGSRGSQVLVMAPASLGSTTADSSRVYGSSDTDGATSCTSNIQLGILENCSAASAAAIRIAQSTQM
jgi:hypothetical protein